MKKKLRLIMVLLLLVVVFVFGQSEEISYQNDYYEAVNAEFLSDKNLNEEEVSWSLFWEAQEEVDEEVDAIVLDMVNDNEMNGLSYNVRTIYQKVIDSEERNVVGLGILNSYLDQVNSSASIGDLLQAIILIENDLGLDLLSNIVVSSDYKDSNRNIIYFYPVTFAFGTSVDYFVDDDYMTYKAYLRKACVELWQVYGYDKKEAREIVAKVFSFYEEVGKHSKLSNELDSVIDYYDLISKDNFYDIYGELVGVNYLEKKRILRNEYSMVDKGQYEYLNSTLRDDNLDTWKYVIMTKILSCYANYASDEYVEIVHHLNSSLMGIEKEFNKEEYALEIVKDMFEVEIGQKYASFVLRDEDKNKIMVMVNEIKEVYGEMLEEIGWFEEATLEKVKEKLMEMEVVIGVDDSEEFDSNFIVGSGSFIDDVVALQKLEYDRILEKLEDKDTSFEVSQISVNAYYRLIDNSIVIPASFLKLVKDDDNYYNQLGSIGMILAHEVSHAFDLNGSLFDSEGMMNNWWTEKDYDNYEELEDKVIAYYSKYEVFPGMFIDGEKTVNENLADLLAVYCISYMASDKGASSDEFKEMYVAFARLWASVEREEYLKFLLLEDVHAPSKYRVNAVLSSMEKFYSVYDVYPWDGMYLGTEERLFG